MLPTSAIVKGRKGSIHQVKKKISSRNRSSLKSQKSKIQIEQKIIKHTRLSLPKIHMSSLEICSIYFRIKPQTSEKKQGYLQFNYNLD